MTMNKTLSHHENFTLQEVTRSDDHSRTLFLHIIVHDQTERAPRPQTYLIVSIVVLYIRYGTSG